MSTKYRMMTVCVMALAQTAGWTASAQEPAKAPAMGHAADGAMITGQDFASKAAVIGKAEIELGQLALKNGSDASVKEFAQRMVDDHTAAAAKLKDIAKRDNLMLPTQLDAEHQATKAKLAALHGDAFDAAYSTEMAKGHDKAVALFESVSRDTSISEDLREYAAATLPTLKEHEALAHSLEQGQ